MSDNTTLNLGNGGDSIASNDIGGVKYQRIKVNYGDPGSATDVSLKNPLPITGVLTDGPQVDAFYRLRMSSPMTLFDHKNLYNAGTLKWANKSVGGGAVNYIANQAAVGLSVGTASGDRAVRQTRKRFNYQPGKSQLIVLTGVFGTGQANTSQRIGYFDDNNGLYFELAGTTLQVVVRSSTSGSPINTAITQSNWNLDKLDGTGPSGVTIDVTKAQIFVIDFQWLGVGRIRFGFAVDGKTIYCHQILNANVISTVYMSVPNLPVRYEIINTAAAAAAMTLTQICSTVISEGGHNPDGYAFSVDRGITTTGTIGTTLTPVLSMRLNSSQPSTDLSDFGFSIMSVGNSNFRYALLLNPTITGGTVASWTAVDTNNSSVQYDTAQNGAVSGGVVLVSGYGNKNLNVADINQIDALNSLGVDVDGNPDTLVLAVQTLSTTDSFVGSLNWLEGR